MPDVLSWLWDNREWIKEKLGSLAFWVREPNERPILILGPGGCGKSTLLRMLTGQRDWLCEKPWEYKESVTQECLSDDSDVEFVAVPGQPHHQKPYWEALKQEIATGKYRGIIFLTAYGYHTIGKGIQIKNHRLYVTGVKHPTAAFLARYLPDRRADELRVLRLLVPSLSVCDQKMWFLTVVAKEDLWTDEHGAVETHYRTGDYGAEIANLVAAKNAATFRHELAFASLVINNFMTAGGELLKKNHEGYDHKAQVESVRGLVELVGGFKDWESE